MALIEATSIPNEQRFKNLIASDSHSLILAQKQIASVLNTDFIDY